MDPFSITVGIIGLADTGANLSKFLASKYKSYNNAPKLLQELAQEVDFTAGWVAVLGNHLDQPGVHYSDKFVSDARSLVQETGGIFEEIRGLVPRDQDLSATFSRAKWRFAANEKKLDAVRERLRRKQFMFMFMDTMYRASAGAETMLTAGSSKDRGPVLVQRETFGEAAPLQLSGVDAEGRRVEVSLSLRTLPGVIESRTLLGAAKPSGRSGPMRSERKDARREKVRLQDLARSSLLDIKIFKVAGMEGISTRMGNVTNEEEKRAKLVKDEQRKAQPKTDDDGVLMDRDEDLDAQREIERLSKMWFEQDDLDAGEEDDTTYEPPEPVATGYGIDEVEPLVPPPPVLSTSSSMSRFSIASELTGTNTKPRQPPPSVSKDHRQSTYTLAGVEAHPRKLRQITCDGCNRKIEAPDACMRCKQCAQGRDNYDLCASCFMNPDITLRHAHGKPHFANVHH